MLFSIRAVIPTVFLVLLGWPRLCLILLVYFSSISKGYCEDWKAVTENFSPYNYVENGKLTGFATDIVTSMATSMEINLNIEVLPWSRAMLEAQNKHNMLIFSILRTSAREEDYHWIGEIDRLPIGIWQLKDNTAIPDKPDVKITYGVIRTLDHNIYSLLKSKYVLSEENIIAVDLREQLLGLLTKRRVDRIVLAEIAWKQLQSELPDTVLKNMARYEQLATESLYIAVSKQTSIKNVNRLREGFEAIIRNSDITMLRKKYGLHSR